MQDQQADLGNAYKTTNENIINGINIYFHSRPDGSFVVHTPKVEKLEDEDTIGPYLPKEKFIPLIDVLRHIDQLVSFNKNSCIIVRIFIIVYQNTMLYMLQLLGMAAISVFQNGKNL